MMICNTLAGFIVASYAGSPFMLVYSGFYIWLSFRLHKQSIGLLRELARLKGISNSPLIQAFTETVSGISTIRAFGKIQQAQNKYSELLDEYQKNCITNEAVSKWFNLRLVVNSGLILIPSVYFNILVVKSGPGVFAILMKYLIDITFSINESMHFLKN